MVCHAVCHVVWRVVCRMRVTLAPLPMRVRAATDDEMAARCQREAELKLREVDERRVHYFGLIDKGQYEQMAADGKFGFSHRAMQAALLINLYQHEPILNQASHVTGRHVTRRFSTRRGHVTGRHVTRRFSTRRGHVTGRHVTRRFSTRRGHGAASHVTGRHVTGHHKNLWPRSLRLRSVAPDGHVTRPPRCCHLLSHQRIQGNLRRVRRRSGCCRACRTSTSC